MEIEASHPQASELQSLLSKEKTQRQNSESLESAKTLVAIAQLLFDHRLYEELFNQLKNLTKKRGQSKKAITSMVQLCMVFIDQLSNLDVKLGLIATLKEVTDKKIYLEVEYARCCLMMVKWNENQSNIEEAAKIMQEVQVETYGSMDKREKLEFILYQMKIMIKMQDMVRLFIISKKIQPKSLEVPFLSQDDTIYDLKIQFYAYLMYYYRHHKQYLQIADCFQQIYDTMDKNPNLYLNNIEFHCKGDLKNIFQNFVVHLAMAPQSAEKTLLLKSLTTKYLDMLDQHQNLKQLVERLISSNLIPTQVSIYCLEILEVFQSQETAVYVAALRKQLVQHNIKVFKSYYEQITLQRMFEMIQVDTQEIEAELCEMINGDMVTARINRVSGVINFRVLENEGQVLNNWSNGLHTLLNVTDQTCNLIKRETEVASN